MQFKTSAPGSVMLLGEYGVLFGKQALVAAVEKRIYITLVPREDNIIRLTSDRLGVYETTLLALKIQSPFQFVLGALKHYAAKLKSGCEITIHSEFSDKIGFGSSAAVTVATLLALHNWLGEELTPLELLRQGRNVIREVQGIGSGADVAASVYGGVVGFQTQPLFAEKFPITFPVTLLYAGYKTKTVDAIKHVQDRFSAYPNLFQSLMNAIGHCASEGITLMRQNEWQKLGTIMAIQQGLMASIGVNTKLLQGIVDELSQETTIYGAKISGSGLGDCVIGLGSVPKGFIVRGLQSAAAGITHIPVALTLQGVKSEKE